MRLVYHRRYLLLVGGGHGFDVVLQVLGHGLGQFVGLVVQIGQPAVDAVQLHRPIRRHLWGPEKNAGKKNSETRKFRLIKTR